jgi:hypothetical protein
MLSCLVYWMFGLLWLSTCSVALAQEGRVDDAQTQPTVQQFELLQSIPEATVQQSQTINADDAIDFSSVAAQPQQKLQRGNKSHSVPQLAVKNERETLTPSPTVLKEVALTTPVHQAKQKELSFGQRIKRFWQKKGMDWLATFGAFGLLFSLLAARISKWAAEAKEMAMSEGLRLGLILILVGILIGILGFASNIFYALGTICIIIGLILIILELIEG